MFWRKKLSGDRDDSRSPYERNLPLILDVVERSGLEPDLVRSITENIRDNSELKDYIENKAVYAAPEINPRGRICRIIFDGGVTDLMNSRGVTDKEGKRICSEIYGSLTGNIKRPIN